MSVLEFILMLIAFVVLTSAGFVIIYLLVHRARKPSHTMHVSSSRERSVEDLLDDALRLMTASCFALRDNDTTESYELREHAVAQLQMLPRSVLVTLVAEEMEKYAARGVEKLNADLLNLSADDFRDK